MRHGFVASISCWLVGGAIAVAQNSAPPPRVNLDVPSAPPTRFAEPGRVPSLEVVSNDAFQPLPQASTPVVMPISVGQQQPAVNNDVPPPPTAPPQPMLPPIAPPKVPVPPKSPAVPNRAAILPPAAPGVPTVNHYAMPAPPTYYPSTELRSPIDSMLPPLNSGGGNVSGGPRYEPSLAFLSADFVLFQIRKTTTPALITTLPASVAQTVFDNDLPIPVNATQTVRGGELDYGTFNGFRLQGGTYFNRDKIWGVDASYLRLQEKDRGFAINSNGVPSLGRFYRDVTDTNGRPDVYYLLALPDGSFRGGASVNTPSKMYTFDLNLRRDFATIISDKNDFLFGFRYFDLRESVRVRDNLRFGTGDEFRLITHDDSFTASNSFYGGQIGMVSHFLGDIFTFDVTGKLAFGGVRQRVDIGGVTQRFMADGSREVRAGGILAQPTNIGSYEKTTFTVLPELLLKAGWQARPWLNFNIGYNLIFLYDVQRAGSTINGNVNPYLSTTIPRPMLMDGQQPDLSRRVPGFAFAPESFWAQGVTFGVTVQY